ncbi:OLC1v1008079C1 [Oldenlandia corymbosa var. corymbosa]|nr:OLC1v1008079C1 [Oldenlandia corymbosa var. corymbosa]
MLRHVGPLNSKSIAPVTYMWRSRQSNSVCKVGETGDYDEQQSVDNCALLRQLWLWIHPSAFSEGYCVLQSECERTAGRLITCMSLEGKLAKLELIGSRAFELIWKILQPIRSVSMDSCALQKCSVASTDGKTHFQDASSLPDEDKISMSAVISLMVNDPRVLVGKSLISEPEVGGSNESENERNTFLDGTKLQKMGTFSSLFSWPEQSYQSLEFADLWDSRKGILPPLEESILCKEKYRQSLKFFGVAHRNLGKVDASQETTSSEYSQLCPIMLLKDNLSDRFSRWSIILPLSWVKVFWIAIVSNGAQAIGLRERHWIAREAGLPCFPSDFPDTKAYSRQIEVEDTMKEKKAKLQPPSLRPPRVLPLPCWEQVQSMSQIKSLLARDTNILPVADLSCKNVYCNTAVLDCDGVSFNGYVARTSFMLIHSLAHFGGNNLFLTTKVADGKNWLPKVLKDMKTSEHSENGVCSNLKCSQNLFFARVHLSAYREGVYEEGAVVCAPLSNDITLLTTRSEDGGEKCQIPQSLLSSCFDQQPARIIEFQLLKDLPDSESTRRPIGFVTTGFVQGSKKPMATAVCEVSWLAHLRENQWKNIPKHQGRKEIYVLVRNLRSTAYRLALATIVLETQENDLEFM